MTHRPTLAPPDDRAWPPAARRFAEAAVRSAGRLVAMAAMADDRRSPLDWVRRVFFESLNDELERRGLTRGQAADMFGWSRRTFNRRLSAVRSAQAGGRPLWIRIVGRLREVRLTREALAAEFSWVPEPTFVAMVRDLESHGWIVRAGDDRLTMGTIKDLSPDALRTFLFTPYGDDQARAERIAEELGLPVADIVVRKGEHGSDRGPATRWTLRSAAYEQLVRYLCRATERADEGDRSSSWLARLVAPAGQAERLGAMRAAARKMVADLYALDTEHEAEIERGGDDDAPPVATWRVIIAELPVEAVKPVQAENNS